MEKFKNQNILERDCLDEITCPICKRNLALSSVGIYAHTRWHIKKKEIITDKSVAEVMRELFNINYSGMHAK